MPRGRSDGLLRAGASPGSWNATSAFASNEDSPSASAFGYRKRQFPEREMLRTKLAKHYESAGRPVDLVLYYDKESWLVGDVPVCDDPQWPWHAGHVMVPLITAAPRIFNAIWIFDRHRCKILWSHASPAESSAASDP